VRSAIAHFKQAIEMEPDYAMAHAMLAAAYNQLVWGGFRSAADMRTLTEASVARALEADPALGLAHAVRMALSIVHDWDWTTANVEGQRAIALDPNGSGIRAGYAMIYYLPARRYDEAVKEVLTAIELDPLNPVFHVNLGSVYRADERDEEAIGHFERAIEIENTNPLANWYMGETLARQENYDAAFKFLAVARTAAPQNAYVVSAIGYALARSGRIKEARQILAELDQMETSRYVPPTSRARITAGLGEIEATLALLERAANEREARIVHVLIQPEFRLLHGEPRFEALVDRLGLAG
jgi:serine/threonine-protein kinase